MKKNLSSSSTHLNNHWLVKTMKNEEALAIRHIFSLVDMITKQNFQIALMFIKIGKYFGSKICIVSIKICFFTKR